jgi:membrane-associated protease RseP (regulator of RpoE activity)
MKKLFTAALLLLSAVPLLADGPVRRTVIIKDGKVISNTGDLPADLNVFQLDGDLLGGKRAYLGVSLIDLTTELREHYGASKEAGVLVGSIEDGSPADKAGLRVGDIVVAIDGKDVDSAGDVRSGLREKKDGDTVRVEVLRGRARQTLVASVVEREGPRLFGPGDLGGLGRTLNSPEWKARIESLGDCGSLQGRIKELESRLKELEKRLQK